MTDALIIERDHLAIDNRLVRQFRQALHDVGISAAEVIVVPGAEVDSTSSLERDCPVAVKFQLVFPPRAIVREAVGPQQ
jgi:hypothetical protein